MVMIHHLKINGIKTLPSSLSNTVVIQKNKIYPICRKDSCDFETRYGHNFHESCLESAGKYEFM